MNPYEIPMDFSLSPDPTMALSRFNIIDVVMVSAMGPPGGGRTFITERWKTRHLMAVS